ncbi:MAG: N-acetylmuramoyl-L-alanine amidase [Dehalococcoidia bacterium]|nr:N-acetylmuramoyl-L-alanine amidase [Dehalococcoidia bacterium]
MEPIALGSWSSDPIPRRAVEAVAQRYAAHPRYFSVIPLYYELAPRYRLRPSVALAQAAHETGWGHFRGVVPATFHNWCGLKTATGGADDDPFAHARFPDDRTGVLAHVQHLAAYAGTVEPKDVGDPVVSPRLHLVRWKSATVVEDLGGRWAPSREYGDRVSRIVRTFWEEAVNQIPRELDPQHLAGVPLRVQLVPPNGRNVPGIPLVPQWITVHETANPNPGANAQAHWRFVANGGGSDGVSYHFAVDDREVVQILPLATVAWHAGDGPLGPGNRTSIAIETCVNADADWERTLRNLVALLVALCRQLALPPDRIVQHNRWSGKNCPARIRAEGRWDRLLADVRAALAPASSDVVVVGPYARTLGHGFLAFWRQLERVDPTLPLRVLGWPLTGEFALGTATYQVFERGVLKYARNEPAPWDVHVAPWAEALAARAEAERQRLLP